MVFCCIILKDYALCSCHTNYKLDTAVPLEISQAEHCSLKSMHVRTKLIEGVTILCGQGIIYGLGMRKNCALASEN